MTNDVLCIGLTRKELQTLRVLLPTTFPILTTEPDALDESMIEHIAEQARCVVLNPTQLTAVQLDEFLYAQRRLLENQRPVPILLFSANMTRQQHHEIRMPEYPILVIDLHKRIDRNRKLSVKLLRDSSLPCWQGRYTMRGNMLNDGWWLIDIETNGLDIWKARIIAIRYTQMADYKVCGETTLYIRQPERISELTRITDNRLARGISLEEAVSELEALPCGDTPFVFMGKDFTAGFLNAAFLHCCKTFERPCLTIDKLANISFGYLMQRRARNIPSMVGPELPGNVCLDTELQTLYALTKCTFEALLARYDVHCPGQFDKLYAADITDA